MNRTNYITHTMNRQHPVHHQNDGTAGCSIIDAGAAKPNRQQLKQHAFGEVNEDKMRKNKKNMQ